MKFVLDKGYILIDVIKNLISKNLSLNDIADVVNLSVDEVKNIIKEQNLEIDLNK